MGQHITGQLFVTIIVVIILWVLQVFALIEIAAPRRICATVRKSSDAQRRERARAKYPPPAAGECTPPERPACVRRGYAARKTRRQACHRYECATSWPRPRNMPRACCRRGAALLACFHLGSKRAHRMIWRTSPLSFVSRIVAKSTVTRGPLRATKKTPSAPRRCNTPVPCGPSRCLGTSSNGISLPRPDNKQRTIGPGRTC